MVVGSIPTESAKTRSSVVEHLKCVLLYMNHINKTPKVTKPVTGSSLAAAMYKASSVGETQNGAVTYTRSGSLLLDFYAQAGAMRKSPEVALDLFKKAFAEDKEKAIRILFYLRDVRGGQGERDLFRNCLAWLIQNDMVVFKTILEHVPEYGRWDDMLFDNPYVWSFVTKKLKDDFASDAPSLLAKWLPTINASSPTTRAKARIVIEKMSMSEISYRKIVREIRKKIKTVEEKMSARKWSDIDYSAVPSQAARIYKDAFKSHDDARYSKFIEKAEKGEVKINAGTLYPYQIYKDVQTNYSKTLEALWNQLPDYTRGNNGLVVADVSGSMTGDPMAVSVSLALYFAEKNQGPFKDHFITFSAEPELQRIVGNNLAMKMNSIETSEWGMNTNLEAVFKLILNSATQNKVSQDEMPETIYIISDMEFDACVSGTTLHKDLKEKYKDAGYKLPNVVFWNVNASGKNTPVMTDESGVALVSGFSPVIFKMVTENKSPEEVMMDTINSDRYARITL